jgi:type IV pilus assembly protein PilW
MKNLTAIKQKGFTIIELMITLVLSLLITYSIAQVLISSNRTSVTSDGMSQSQETGRFVMSYLAKYIRQAGLDSIDSNDTVDAFIDSSQSGVTSDQSISDGSIAAQSITELTVHEQGINHSDRLAIAWIPPSADQLSDCTGRTDVYDLGDVILNVFWIEPDPNNPDPIDPDLTSMNNLVCQAFKYNDGVVSDASAEEAIAYGVEAMHLLYGEANDSLPSDNDRNVSRYVNADDVDDWDRVYAVRVSILTRSIVDVTNSVATRTYVLLDSIPYIMDDAVSRQVFTTTFVINNYN